LGLNQERIFVFHTKKGKVYEKEADNKKVAGVVFGTGIGWRAAGSGDNRTNAGSSNRVQIDGVGVSAANSLSRIHG
jgi:hypothetical protein